MGRPVWTRYITVEGPLPSSSPQTVDCDSVQFMGQPFTVGKDGHRRGLAPDVAALVFKAYGLFRSAVRQADGFLAEADVPAVTVRSIADGDGDPWVASATIGYGIGSYTNWLGEVFDVVFEPMERRRLRD